MRKPLGLILYQGPSLFSPLHRIAVVLTGLRVPSKNAKAGEMLQIWIIPVDGGIRSAVATGTDEAVCGACPLRPSVSRRIGRHAPRCYVRTDRAPAGVSRAYHAGSYVGATPELLARYVAGRRVRLGAWGDPASVPASVWESVTTLPGVRWTGYTHGHLMPGVDVSGLRPLIMLSADSAEIALAYQAKGWRTFRVRHGAGDPLLPGEISCPASAEAGARVQCDQCLLCDGAARLDIRRLPSIAIIDHGPTARAGK